jgi:hypothetical protein
MVLEWLILTYSKLTKVGELGDSMKAWRHSSLIYLLTMYSGIFTSSRVCRAGVLLVDYDVGLSSSLEESSELEEEDEPLCEEDSSPLPSLSSLSEEDPELDTDALLLEGIGSLIWNSAVLPGS